MNSALAVGFALFAALSFGTFSVMARKAMNVGTAYAAALVTVLIGIPIMLAMSFIFSSWEKLTLEAALWFTLAGMLAPGIGRTLVYLSIRYIGVSRAMSLMALTPFTAMVAAVVFLGERPGLAVLGATLCVVAGCALLAVKPEGDRGWKRIHLLLPLAQSIAVAFAAVTRRHSLLLFPDFIIGSTIAIIAALPVMLLFMPLLPKTERFRIDPGKLGIFIMCGLVNTCAFLSFFAAFQFGQVYFVMPVGFAAPFFTLIFSKIWLKEEEPLTWQKWAGALALFLGVVIVAMNAP